jgi:hypothetical protein
MVTVLFGACFVISFLVGAWALYMLADWIIHGCPDRYQYPSQPGSDG